MPEWKEQPVQGDMDQVNDLIKLIQAHKLMGVPRASIMYSWIGRRIQPLQNEIVLDLRTLVLKIHADLLQIV